MFAYIDSETFYLHFGGYRIANILSGFAILYYLTRIDILREAWQVRRNDFDHYLSGMVGRWNRLFAMIEETVSLYSSSSSVNKTQATAQSEREKNNAKTS